MGFGALRSIVRPLSRSLISRFPTSSTTQFPSAFTTSKSLLLGGSAATCRLPQWFPLSSHFHSLTDTRFPKRRPSDKSRRKRSTLRPSGFSNSPLLLKFIHSLSNNSEFSFSAFCSVDFRFEYVNLSSGKRAVGQFYQVGCSDVFDSAWLTEDFMT